MTRDFLTLFRGNPEVVGLDDAGRGKPGPLRFDAGDEREAKWLALVDGHLAGLSGIGVYPVNHERAGAVRWGCVDFDDGFVESWSHALNLRQLLHDYGLPAWIERSRSKGYHVWLFSRGWVEAAVMRQLLLGACDGVGAPSKEVNPKSERLDPDQLGNFVRLPYFGANAGPLTHQVIVDLLGKPMPLNLFVEEALESAIPVRQVLRAAPMLYVRPAVTEAPAVPVRTGPWQDRLNGLASIQFYKGPIRQDRSAYLMAFGHACAESGLTEQEITKAVRAADLIHTHKYEGRKDAPVRYVDIARKAINREQEVSQPW